MSCLIGGNTSTYKYGADGLRRQSTKNSTSTDYAYDATMMVREGHATGGTLTASTVTATYFQGASGPCYRRDDTATELDSQGQTVAKARWYVYDGLGSVVGEVDPLGNLTSSPKYDVYGATRGNGGTASSKQGFVGSLGHVLEDMGLIYMRARYYDPAVGRFASEDPAEDGKNWYAYCKNNPINRTDFTGKTAGSTEDVEATAAAESELNASDGNIAFAIKALARKVAQNYQLRNEMLKEIQSMLDSEQSEESINRGWRMFNYISNNIAKNERAKEILEGMENMF